MGMTSGVLPEKAPAERAGRPAGQRAGPHTVIQTFHSEISFITEIWLPLLACLINLWFLQEMGMTSSVLPEKAPAKRAGRPARQQVGPRTLI